MEELICKIEQMAMKYRNDLQQRIQDRQCEMVGDNNEHYLLYNVLGISNREGANIDLYQNVGRFLYKYAGSFIEEAAIECFRYAYPQAEAKVMLPNTVSTNPRNVEIDCSIDSYAIEIKWRDATTDGDHIKKEQNRVNVIMQAGYTPIRLMFYYPNREQAIRIQARLAAIYNQLGGEYYAGDNAWNYIYQKTGVDLKAILIEIRNRMIN